MRITRDLEAYCEIVLDLKYDGNIWDRDQPVKTYILWNIISHEAKFAGDQWKQMCINRVYWNIKEDPHNYWISKSKSLFLDTFSARQPNKLPWLVHAEVYLISMLLIDDIRYFFSIAFCFLDQEIEESYNEAV